jgi:hypothetical protein
MVAEAAGVGTGTFVVREVAREAFFEAFFEVVFEAGRDFTPPAIETRFAAGDIDRATAPTLGDEPYGVFGCSSGNEPLVGCRRTDGSQEDISNLTCCLFACFVEIGSLLGVVPKNQLGHTAWFG